MTRQNGTGFAYAMLVAVVILGSSGNIVGKFVVGDLPAFTVGATRTLLALIVLVFILKRKEGVFFPKQRDWPMLFVLGLSGVFGSMALFYLAVQYTSVTNCSLVSAGTPIVITLLSTFMLKERVTLWQVFGVILSFGGVVVVITNASWSVFVSKGLNVGDLIILGSPICFGLYTVVTKKLIDHYSPLALTTYAHVTGAIIYIPFMIYELISVRSGMHVSAADVGALVYLGIMCASIGSFLWNMGVKKVGASRSGIFLNGIPIGTMLFATTLLGEKITLAQILGSAMVISGVIINSLRGSSNQHSVENNFQRNTI